MSWLLLVVALAPPVTLTVDPCAQVPEPELRRVVELELLSTRASITGLTAAVTCEAEALSISVEDPLTRKTLQRTVDLSRAVPNARARLLGLAIVEVVEAYWSEQLFAPPPTPAPAPAPVAVPVALVSAPPERPLGNFRFFATASSRALLASPLWQFGGGARVVHTPFRYLGWASELTAEQGSYSTNLGLVEVTSGSGALELLGQLELGPVALQLGAGGRGGIVNARGIPRVPLVTAKQLTGGWAGVFGGISGSVGFGWWVLTLRIEVGQVLLGMASHVENTNTGMDGPWFAMTVGFGIRP